jgi:hypothetical protein
VQTSKELIECVELIRLRQMGEVPGVKDKVRLTIQGVNFFDGGLEGCAGIGIRRLGEPYVTVADLYKSEVCRARLGWRAEQARYRHTSRKAPCQAAAGPLHARQKAAPVNLVMQMTRCILAVIGGDCLPTEAAPHQPICEVTDMSGYHLARWTRNKMSYWAVSDVATADLRQFAELVRGT